MEKLVIRNAYDGYDAEIEYSYSSDSYNIHKIEVIDDTGEIVEITEEDAKDIEYVALDQLYGKHDATA